MGWCKYFCNDVFEGKKFQLNVLVFVIQNDEVMDSEWILMMDVDEFLLIKCGKGWIFDFVECILFEVQVMVIMWCFFGLSEVIDWNLGLVIEYYICVVFDKFKKGWGVKMLFWLYEYVKLGIYCFYIKNVK